MEFLGSILQGDTAILVFILICFVALMVMFYRVARGLDEISKELQSQRDDELKIIAVQSREHLALMVRYQREAIKILETLSQSVPVEPRPASKAEAVTQPAPAGAAIQAPEPPSPRADATAATSVAAGVAAGVAVVAMGEALAEDADAGVEMPDLDIVEELPASSVVETPVEEGFAEADYDISMEDEEEAEDAFISLDDEGDSDMDVSDLMDVEEDTSTAPVVEDEDALLIEDLLDAEADIEEPSPAAEIEEEEGVALEPDRFDLSKEEPEFLEEIEDIIESPALVSTEEEEGDLELGQFDLEMGGAEEVEEAALDISTDEQGDLELGQFDLEMGEPEEPEFEETVEQSALDAAVDEEELDLDLRMEEPEEIEPVAPPVVEEKGLDLGQFDLEMGEPEEELVPREDDEVAFDLDFGAEESEYPTEELEAEEPLLLSDVMEEEAPEVDELEVLEPESDLSDTAEDFEMELRPSIDEGASHSGVEFKPDDSVFSDSLGLVPEVDDLDETARDEELLGFTVEDRPVSPMPSMDDTMFEALNDELPGGPGRDAPSGVMDQEFSLLDEGEVDEGPLFTEQDDLFVDEEVTLEDEADITSELPGAHQLSEFSLEDDVEFAETDEPDEQHVDFGPEDDDQELDLLIENLVDVSDDESQPDDELPEFETELILDDEEEPETMLDIPENRPQPRQEMPDVISMDDEDEDSDLAATLSMEDFDAIMGDTPGGALGTAAPFDVSAPDPDFIDDDEDLLVIMEEDEDGDLSFEDLPPGTHTVDSGELRKTRNMNETIQDLTLNSPEEASAIAGEVDFNITQETDAEDDSFSLGDLDLLLEDDDVPQQAPPKAPKPAARPRDEVDSLQLSDDDIEIDFDLGPQEPSQPAKSAAPASKKPMDWQQTVADEEDLIDFIIDDDEDKR